MRISNAPLLPLGTTDPMSNFDDSMHTSQSGYRADDVHLGCQPSRAGLESSSHPSDP